MFMQFDVGLSFEITNLKCNSCILILLSLIFKIRYMHSYKHMRETGALEKSFKDTGEKTHLGESGGLEKYLF